MNSKKYSASELFGMFKNCGTIFNNKYDLIFPIIELIKSGDAVVRSKKWQSKTKSDNPDWYPLNLEEPKTWSTYGKCISLSFRVEEIVNEAGNSEQKIICFAKVYEGDMVNGLPKEKRFEATIIMPDSYIYELEKDIEYDFDSFLNKAYERHLEVEKLRWISNMKDEFLTIFKNKSNDSERSPENVKISDWIVIDEDCATRVFEGSDPTKVENRVAFIEKHPRVRIAPFVSEDTDSQNWLFDRGTSERGFDEESRNWCDSKLLELGYSI